MAGIIIFGCLVVYLLADTWMENRHAEKMARIKCERKKEVD